MRTSLSLTSVNSLVADFLLPALCVLASFAIIAGVYRLGRGVRRAEGAFSDAEEITRPTNEAHRANRLLERWKALAPDRKKLVEQLVAEFTALEYVSKRK